VIDGQTSASADALEPLGRTVPLAEQAYLAIREAIATRRIRPGERLTERGLAMLLGVSPTPVREALRRLAQEGLVERPTPRTLAVVAHSAEGLLELQYAEIMLRGTLARIAAAKATQPDIARLTGIVEELEASAEGDAATVLDIAARFDQAVSDIADNAAITALYRTAEIFGQDRRVRSVELMQTARRDLGQRHLRAHRALVEAVTAHDQDRAERVVREHLGSTLALLLSELGEQR
jgi:DNA-binding GntR family transcriptional regulator